MKGDVSMRDRGYGRDVVRPKAKKRAPEDSGLQKLWRQVVRAEWHNRCAMEGTLVHDAVPSCGGPLECHHIKRRKILHLKHVPSNGVLLCKVHHDLIAYRSWRMVLERILGEDRMEKLDDAERILLPEYLRSIGKTRTEYLIAQKVYLTALLNGRTA
jgi:predicted restriction endonuclease